MSIALKHRSVVARVIVWIGLQAMFFVWVHPEERWMRRDTKVYFCFAAFALASLSLVAILPLLSRVSPAAKILIIAMLATVGWELFAATRILLYQF